MIYVFGLGNFGEEYKNNRHNTGRMAVEFFANVIFKGRVTFNNDTAGIAIIPKWSQKVTVPFEKPYDKPPIVNISLVLDEATSSLDSHSESLIQEALDTLMRGRTSIVIAHRLSTVQNADKLYAIDNGEIIESGTPMELLDKKDSYFSKVYNT